MSWMLTRLVSRWHQRPCRLEPAGLRRGPACALWTAMVVMMVLALPSGWAAAQDEGQVGLVIRFPDGRVETTCIPFDGQAIGGDQVLARSGLDVVIDPSSGMGITVCQIEGQGCAYPQEQCFCRCMGGESCGYWNYYYREPGGETWLYSPLGALLRDVPPGGMEAWVWGDGSAPPPAELTFAAVCAAPTPEPTLQAPTATRTPTPGTTETPAVLVTEAPALPPSTATPAVAQVTATSLPASATVTAPTATGSLTTAPAETPPPGGTGYWAFGLILAALAGAGLVVWLRQRGERRS